MRLTIEKLGIDMQVLGDEMADAFTLRREEMSPLSGVIEACRNSNGEASAWAWSPMASASSSARDPALQPGRAFSGHHHEGESGMGKPDRSVLWLHWSNWALALPGPGWWAMTWLGHPALPGAWLGTVWVDF